jgi:hypothetical protein
MVTKIPLLVRSEFRHKAAIVIHILPQGLEENLFTGRSHQFMPCLRSSF